MSKSVVGIFQSERVAKEAIDDLRKAGFEREISLLSKNKEAGPMTSGGPDMETGSISDGVTTGGVLGALGGLAMGAGALVIPGIGPLIAAGPIAGLLSGAASGGIAGGLIDWGIPEEEGRSYEEDIKQNKVMVAVSSSDEKIDTAANILRNHGAERIKTHNK